MTNKPLSGKHSISQFYAELNKSVQSENYDKAIKITNKILNVDPQEIKAFQYKIICLIHLSRFEDAISLISKNEAFSEELRFEKSYCYYRLNKHEDALNEIDMVQDKDSRHHELKAQILYRLENYVEALKSYKKLTKTVHDDYDDERHTNIIAVLSQMNTSKTINDIQQLPDNTYELCFNKACTLINYGLLVEAEKKLKHCEKMCKELLEEEDASEEEINIELALIRIQLAYVYQKQSRIKEAQQIYTSNLKYKLKDAALVAVASNNIVCINKDQNLFDSKKKMKLAHNEALVFKLPSLQRKIIGLNNAILHYYMHQMQQCEQLCLSIEKQWPDLSKYCVVLRALTKIKGTAMGNAIEIIKNYKNSHQDSDELYTKLAIAHLYLAQGDKIHACSVLENLGDNTYRPGIIGALTTLYLNLGDEGKALKLFENTVNWYRSKDHSKSIDLTSMWRQAAEFHIKCGHPHVAVNSLEELLRHNPHDRRIIAQLILACSQYDRDRAIALSSQLPSVAEITAGLDIAELQNTTNLFPNIKRSPGTTKETPQETPRGDIRVKKRKAKKKKLPKNMVEGVTPDPERWLPKYERSAYRRKKDRRVKEVIKGSQGTASTQAEQFDFSSKIIEPETEAPAVEPSPKSKAQHHTRSKQNKKKSKRR